MTQQWGRDQGCISRPSWRGVSPHLQVQQTCVARTIAGAVLGLHVSICFPRSEVCTIQWVIHRRSLTWGSLCLLCVYGVLYSSEDNSKTVDALGRIVDICELDAFNKTPHSDASFTTCKRGVQTKALACVQLRCFLIRHPAVMTHSLSEYYVSDQRSSSITKWAIVRWGMIMSFA